MNFNLGSLSNGFLQSTEVQCSENRQEKKTNGKGKRKQAITSSTDKGIDHTLMAAEELVSTATGCKVLNHFIVYSLTLVLLLHCTVPHSTSQSKSLPSYKLFWASFSASSKQYVLAKILLVSFYHVTASHPLPFVAPSSYWLPVENLIGERDWCLTDHVT